MANPERPRAGTPRPGGEGVNLILAGTRIDGVMNFPGGLVVSGELKGDIVCEGALVIEPGGKVDGRVQAPTVTAHGALSGTVLVTEFLEVCSGAVVGGTVMARSVRVDLGAILTADLSITANLPASLNEPAAPAQPAMAPETAA